jgi:tetratricopeptide (TPR) repeat protein
VNPRNFFAELKRRNVYRAAVAYGVVAWFLTQLTTQVFPFFEIPNSAVRFVVIALAVGFPIAMLLSWLYEFTPEGIVRTGDLDPVQARSVERATGRILDFIIIGVLLLVIAMLIVGRRPFYGQTGESISQKSIAVLPFENRSEDKANAYFADGIQDEILTRLSKIADLKVISRTSTQHYKSAPENLPEIARQLGVGHILEGSVQKSGVDALGYFTQSLQPTAALREETRQTAETALTLQPNLGEAMMAKGYYYYGCLKDYDSAVRYFEQARQFLPNNSRIPESLAEARPVGPERVVL